MVKSVDSMVSKNGQIVGYPAARRMPTKLQIALDALEAYVTSNSWAEAKRVVETYRDILLTDMIDDVLVTLITQYENADVIRMLTHYRKVLVHCRVAGVDVAFAELLTERETCPPGVDLTLWRRVLLADSYAETMDLLAEHPELIPHIRRRIARTMNHSQRVLLYALEALLDTDSWDGVKEIIERNPALLGLDADIWLSQYADSLVRQGEVDAAAIVTARRWLLADCRIAGIGATFSEGLLVWDGVRVEVEIAPVLGWVMPKPTQAV